MQQATCSEVDLLFRRIFEVCSWQHYAYCWLAWHLSRDRSTTALLMPINLNGTFTLSIASGCPRILLFVLPQEPTPPFVHGKDQATLFACSLMDMGAWYSRYNPRVEGSTFVPFKNSLFQILLMVMNFIRILLLIEDATGGWHQLVHSHHAGFCLWSHSCSICTRNALWLESCKCVCLGRV